MTHEIQIEQRLHKLESFCDNGIDLWESRPDVAMEISNFAKQLVKNHTPQEASRDEA